MYLKIHESGGQRIVAACDEGLIGRTLTDGKRYLDFSSQLVNTNIGHQHPRVTAAIAAQAAKLATIAPQHANEARGEAATRIASSSRSNKPATAPRESTRPIASLIPRRIASCAETDRDRESFGNDAVTAA